MQRSGKRGIIYLSLHCHRQNDSFIKMDSQESYFNVSLIVGDKVTRQCPQTTTLEGKGEPKRVSGGWRGLNEDGGVGGREWGRGSDHVAVLIRRHVSGVAS